MMPFDLETFVTSFIEGCTEYKWWVSIGLIACLLLLFIRRCRIHRLPIRTSTNELGELYVSRGAILHLVRNLGQELQNVYVNRIKIKDKKHTLMVRLNVKICEDVSFDEISIQFQEKIQQIILRYLGVTKTVRVNVILDDVEKLPTKEEPEPKEEEDKL